MPAGRPSGLRDNRQAGLEASFPVYWTCSSHVHMPVGMCVNTGPGDRAQSLDGDRAVGPSLEQVELPPIPQDTALKEGPGDPQGIEHPSPSQTLPGEKSQGCKWSGTECVGK